MYVYVITFFAVLVIYIIMAIKGCSVFAMMLVDYLNLVAKLEGEKNLLFVSLENQKHTHTHNWKLIITVSTCSMGQLVSKYLCIKVSCKMKKCV